MNDFELKMYETIILYNGVFKHILQKLDKIDKAIEDLKSNE